MQGDVADEALRDLGLRRVDGDAAAVLVVDGDHIVYVGVLGQKIPADAGDGVVHYADDALDRGIDTEDVAGAARALAPGIGVAHPGFDGRLGQVCHDVLRKTHTVQIGCRSHDKVCLVDPAAAGHIRKHGAEHDAVAHDLTACRDIAEGDLVCLGNILLQHSTVGKRCTLRKVADGDGDIVAFVDFDTECFHSCLLKTGRKSTDPLFFIRSGPLRAWPCGCSQGPAPRASGGLGDKDRRPPGRAASPCPSPPPGRRRGPCSDVRG